MVTGQVGQGKSDLVNTLIGKVVATKGDGPRSVTHGIESFTEYINGVKVTLIDTPGFNDPDISDAHIIAEIGKIGCSIDLILFCVKMNRRMEKTDYRIMRKLTHVFGQSIWKNVVFVLTFANEVNPNTFENTRAEWDEVLHEYARTKGEVQDDVAQRIPVVVAGNEENDLPACQSWLDQFWVTAYNQTKDKAKPAYLTLTLNLNELKNLVNCDSSSSEDESRENSGDHNMISSRSSQRTDGTRYFGTGGRHPYRTTAPDTGGTRRRTTPAPDTGGTRHHPTPAPDTGGTRRHTTLVPDTGGTRRRTTPAPDAGTTRRHATRRHTTSAPDTGVTHRHTTPAPDTGATHRHTTPAPGTGATHRRTTPASGTGATRCHTTPAPDTGATRRCTTPAPDTGGTRCHTTPAPDTGATRRCTTPAPDTGGTRCRTTPAPDTGATRHCTTPAPDTGGTCCRTTPAPDTGGTRRHPTPAPDTGATKKKTQRCSLRMLYAAFVRLCVACSYYAKRLRYCITNTLHIWKT